MDYWTFDGGVPGPMIRCRAGDTIDFFLHNPTSSSLPHNVDFHAVTGPGGGAAHLGTAPGDVSELKARLLNPGIFIYHCAFPDIPMHISHGMYGLIVVEPEGGLPPVDHEFYLMQSEFYTERGGRQQYVQLRDAGHLAFSSEFGHLEQPTFVVFNGRPESTLGDRALGVFGGSKISVGQTVRLFVGNIGPNLISSFHVIGEIFDRVYVEGSFDLVNRNVQTTIVPAGGAAGVEFRVEYPGDYVIVDHAIFRLHKGAGGAIHVEGSPDPAVYESIKYSTQLGTSGH
jgi:nitrite reductase (NO-forming)